MEEVDTAILRSLTGLGCSLGQVNSLAQLTSQQIIRNRYLPESF
jgi:hypothetical protein